MHDYGFLEPMLGGTLIGFSATLFVMLTGRVAGISGILDGLLPPHRSDASWRVFFILGLIGSPFLLVALKGPLPELEINSSWQVLTASGIFVGFGTRLGGGCTSGHGVCGLARLSPRSMVATLVFMVMGVVAASLLRPLILG